MVNEFSLLIKSSVTYRKRKKDMQTKEYSNKKKIQIESKNKQMYDDLDQKPIKINKIII